MLVDAEMEMSKVPVVLGLMHALDGVSGAVNNGAQETRYPIIVKLCSSLRNEET